jgi:hypothetical protein
MLFQRPEGLQSLQVFEVSKIIECDFMASKPETASCSYLETVERVYSVHKPPFEVLRLIST